MLSHHWVPEFNGRGLQVNPMLKTYIANLDYPYDYTDVVVYARGHLYCDSRLQSLILRCPTWYYEYRYLPIPITRGKGSRIRYITDGRILPIYISYGMLIYVLRCKGLHVDCAKHQALKYHSCKHVCIEG